VFIVFEESLSKKKIRFMIISITITKDNNANNVIEVHELIRKNNSNIINDRALKLKKHFLKLLANSVVLQVLKMPSSGISLSY